MLKSFLLCLGLLCLLISCQPETAAPSEFPRHRFADRPQMYTLFDEVKKEYLFVDRVGETLFDGATVTSKDDFRDGAMRLWIKEKPAIIDDAGHFLVPLGFDRLLYYQNGDFFAWKDSTWTYRDTTGTVHFTLSKEIQPHGPFGKNGLAVARINNYRYGYMDTLGQLAIEGEYYQVNAFESFSMTGVQSARSPRKWGYINTQGDMLIEPQFDYIMGSPSYEQEIDFAYSSTTGYTVVNKTLGKAVMDSIAAYYYCPGFSQWIGIKKMNGKAGFIDKAGNVVIPFDFTDVDCFDNRGLAPAKNEKYWGFINTDGDFIKEPEYIFVHKFEDDDYAIVSPYLTTVGMINRQGEQVIPPDFYNFKTRNGMRSDWDLLFARGKQGAGYIDRSGAFVTETHFLEKGYNFHDREHAPARDSSHYVGLINRKGEFVIPPQFDFLQFEGDSDILRYVIDRKTGYFTVDQNRYFVYPKDTLEQMVQSVQAARGPDWQGF